MTQMPDIFKPQRRFMCCLIAALQAFSGRATMANLSRYALVPDVRWLDVLADL